MTESAPDEQEQKVELDKLADRLCQQEEHVRRATPNSCKGRDHCQAASVLPPLLAQSLSLWRAHPGSCHVILLTCPGPCGAACSCCGAGECGVGLLEWVGCAVGLVAACCCWGGGHCLDASPGRPLRQPGDGQRANCRQIARLLIAGACLCSFDEWGTVCSSWGRDVCAQAVPSALMHTVPVQLTNSGSVTSWEGSRGEGGGRAALFPVCSAAARRTQHGSSTATYI